MRVLSKEGGVSADHISRLASFRGGTRNDGIRSLDARLYHMIASGSGSDFAARFYSYINPSDCINLHLYFCARGESSPRLERLCQKKRNCLNLLRNSCF